MLRCGSRRTIALMVFKLANIFPLSASYLVKADSEVIPLKYGVAAMSINPKVPDTENMDVRCCSLVWAIGISRQSPPPLMPRAVSA